MLYFAILVTSVFLGLPAPHQYVFIIYYYYEDVYSV